MKRQPFSQTGLAKCLSVRLRIKWLWVRIPLQSLMVSYGHGDIYVMARTFLENYQCDIQRESNTGISLFLGENIQ